MAHYVNHYHDGIHQADALIERIFGHLQAKRLLDDAIVIITADHGEMLGEAAHPNHGGPPLDPVIRVPLMIYDTDGFAYPPRTLASVTDVAPTFLDRVGAPVPTHWMGESLARAETRRFTLAQGGSAYAVMGRFGDELYKYHFDGDDGRERLFNLSRDRAEREPLPLAAHASVVRDLRGQLDAQRPALRAAR
jgi:arylsulfatase A-like enzyme